MSLKPPVIAALVLSLWRLASASISSVTCAEGRYWTIPVNNTDGSGLTDLVAYQVYRGVSVSALLPYALLAPPVHTWVDTVGVPGTYYYAVAAIDSAGVSSDLSNVVMLIAMPCPTGH